MMRLGFPKKLGAAAMLGVALVALAVPANAENQVVDATVQSTLTMSTPPSASVSGWTLSGAGANTTSGGQVTVSANQPYQMTVVADKNRMSEWTTASSAYVASGKTLTNPLSITAVRSGGTAAVPGVGVAANATTTSALLASGAGLGTDIYDLTLAQTTVLSDAYLGAGKTYHTVVTYTLSSTL